MRAQAGSNDLGWRPLVSEIKAVLPAGVQLVGLKLAPGAAPVAGADPRSGVGLTGTLTFTAEGSSAQAQTITRLPSAPRSEPGTAGSRSS